MKPIIILLGLTPSLVLTACNHLPEACQQYWKQIEKLSKQMGMSNEQIENNKMAFIKKIKKMNQSEATQTCTTDNSFLNMASEK